jgi:hypothetical protein
LHSAQSACGPLSDISRMGFGLKLKGKEIGPLAKQVASKIQKALGLEHVTPSKDPKGGYQLLYFTTSLALTVPSEGGPLPCLPIDTNSQTLLVVEIRIGHGDPDAGSEYFIEHISIKTYFGTSEDATLVFRAEWDARDNDLRHAQPHWNIHERPLPKIESDSFDEFLEREQGFTISKPTESSTSEKDAFDRVRMHFALASTWHLAKGSHSYALENLEQIALWIGGCCAYLRDELGSVSMR